MSFFQMRMFENQVSKSNITVEKITEQKNTFQYYGRGLFTNDNVKPINKPTFKFMNKVVSIQNRPFMFAK